MIDRLYHSPACFTQLLPHPQNGSPSCSMLTVFRVALERVSVKGSVTALAVHRPQARKLSDVCVTVSNYAHRKRRKGPACCRSLSFFVVSFLIVLYRPYDVVQHDPASKVQDETLSCNVGYRMDWVGIHSLLNKDVTHRDSVVYHLK